MLKRILKYIFAIVGASIGFTLSLLINSWLNLNVQYLIATSLFLIILFGIIFNAITPFIIKITKQVINNIERESSSLSLFEISVSVLGIILGLIVAYFISGFTNNVPIFGFSITILVYLFFTFLGYTLINRRRDEIKTLFKTYRFNQPKDKIIKKTTNVKAKILDTSVIIDGRILDICNTGFIDGRIIIPKFVLDELQHIADSADDLKRTKGRRGLDILKDMQESSKFAIEILESTNLNEINEVDAKLVKLAQEYSAKIITNDFNLNKVAQLQGVEILNINELANAVKIMVIPGEEMNLLVVKEGKELNQGLSYLDDGTMIVIENGKKYVGETIDVVVKTVLQTSAGRMIFARLK